jgi:hypothetical protein
MVLFIIYGLRSRSWAYLGATIIGIVHALGISLRIFHASRPATGDRAVPHRLTGARWFGWRGSPDRC